MVVSPVPWKLLGDVSTWSQNWPWIPQPARVPVDVKASVCTLCPKGCGMRVRMAGGWPVGLAGSRIHPVSQGALCPLGFGAHQLIWHPMRLRAVRHRGGNSSWDEARAAFAKACGEGPIGVVDGFPGRAASSIFESFAQKRNGTYRAVLGAETQALTPYEAWTRVPADLLGFDLENARTVVSFGAPLLESWGTPGRFSHLWAERAAGQADPRMRLIQVESSLSTTGARAWRRIAIRPGSETAFAAGIARVLLEDRLVSARGPMPPWTLAMSAGQTGISEDAIRECARTIVAASPALAIARDDNPAVAALNIVLGAVGRRGGIVPRSKARKSVRAGAADLRSMRAVVIDGSVPWDFVPETDAEIFRFAAWDGGATRAQWLLPAPAFLEEMTDVPTAPASAIDTYAIAPALVQAPADARSAAQFLRDSDPTLVPLDTIIHARCEALFRGRTGTLCAQESTPVANLASVEKLEEQLRNGSVWMGEPQPVGELRCDLKAWPADRPATPSLPSSSAWATAVLPPLASKLYQESSLLQPLARRTE